MSLPGRLLYLGWHAPLAALARSRREGGPLSQWQTSRGRQAMEQAARQLPSRPAPTPDAPEVCFLTGRRFWYQTAFCCWSLCQQAGREFVPVFIDDGSFDDALRAEMIRIFPGARVCHRTDVESTLDQFLPEARFPILRSQRRTYLHLRKITDVHVGRRGWRLVLDSDMLFFRRPDALLAWLDAPDRPLHMLDVQNAYGYPLNTLAELAGAPIPEKLNVGVCGLRSDEIDWEKLESWCQQLIARHGTSYYLEQALVALLLARASPQCLPPADYRLMPTDSECLAPTAALHHYVDLSKRGYFRHGWKHVAATAGILSR